MVIFYLGSLGEFSHNKSIFYWGKNVDWHFVKKSKFRSVICNFCKKRDFCQKLMCLGWSLEKNDENIKFTNTHKMRHDLES